MKVLVLLSLLMFSYTSFAAEPSKAENKVVQTKCPVMGTAINKKLYVDHNGKRVYFCCPACVSQFKKDPEKMMKKMEAEGIALEDVPKK